MTEEQLNEIFIYVANRLFDPEGIRSGSGTVWGGGIHVHHIPKPREVDPVFFNLSDQVLSKIPPEKRGELARIEIDFAKANAESLATALGSVRNIVEQK